MANKKRKTVKKSAKKVRNPPKIKAQKKGVMVTISPREKKLLAKIAEQKKLLAEEKKRVARRTKEDRKSTADQKKELAAIKKELKATRRKLSDKAKRLLRSETSTSVWNREKAKMVIRNNLLKAQIDGRFYQEVQDLFVLYDDFFTVNEIYTMGMSP